jgi:uncharacterized membrane protein YhdT
MVWGVCSYVSMVSLWASSHPILASLSACLLPLMFVWALTLCSVMVCVRDCSILIMDSNIFCLGGYYVELGVLFVCL